MTEAIVLVATAYGWCRGAVALAFLLWGIDRIDPAARGAYLVRPLLAPGVVLLWPWVLLRWAALERGRRA
jgi:hypothetical protein